MGKTEIIAELERLSPEELAEVRARLDQLARDARPAQVHSASTPRLRSPRLANPAQARDFVKHVTDLPANGKL
jgi:hypothetical protein